MAGDDIYRTIITHCTDAIICTDEQGIITLWNPSAECTLGRPSDKVTGKPLADVIAGGYTLRDALKEVLATRSPRSAKFTLVNDQNEERHLSVTLSPMAGAGVSLIFRDVTDLHDRIQRLRSNEAIYQSVAANLPDTIITIVDRSRKYVFVEGETLANFNLQKEALTGKLQREALGHKSDFGFLEELTEKAFTGATVTRELVNEDGSFLFRCAPIRDKADAVYAVITITQNITNLRRTEQAVRALNESLEKKVDERTAQLEASMNELESFSYSVSHDLRAPLRIINSYAQLLQHEHGSQLTPDATMMLDVIQTNVRKMNKQIEALLNLARTGAQKPMMSVVDMDGLINEILEEYRHSNKNVAFKVGQLPNVVCDTDLITHVWCNLISNAVKYSARSPRPEVIIDAQKTPNEMVYSVQDNGTGFDMRYSNKLFKVFQRLHSESEYDGTGIGLALVAKIIQRHGGRVWAEAAPEKGATFFFSLPAEAKETVTNHLEEPMI